MAYLYFESLSIEAQERYRKKINLIGMDKCPYKFTADSWINNPKEWPKLQYQDVYHYLIETPGVYTPEAMRNFRSLEAHRFFTSGWVQTIMHLKINESTILKADVKPSYRVTDDPHHPWVALNSVGVVLAGHCDCMAGLGETCSHVAAVLFKIEALGRLGLTASTPTDEPCKWNQCFTEQVTPLPIADIKFYKERSKNQIKNPQNLQPQQSLATEKQRDVFLTALLEGGSKPVVLSCFGNYAQNFLSKTLAPEVKKLPASLRNLYDVSYLKLQKEDLESKCASIYEQFKISSTEQQYVADITILQSASLVWHDQRVGRLTGSTAYAACHTNVQNPAKSLIKGICTVNLTNLNHVPAISWGRNHEEDAYNMYAALITGKKSISDFPKHAITWPDFHVHPGAVTEKIGFVIDKYKPFLGASPDGKFTCSCCGDGIVEIKCPYSLKDCNIKSVVQNSKTFCLDEQLHMIKTHNYYYQMQLQMHVCEVQFGDFIVWTPQECIIQRVVKDEKFCFEMINQLELFWKCCILPELLTRTIENETKMQPLAGVQKRKECNDSDPPLNSASSKLYCICKTPDDDGNMVGCDHCDQWFHLHCLKLKKFPQKKTWYCPTCRKLQKKNKILKIH